MGRVSREVAAQQIDSGILRGYLAFVDGIAIGWCNANDKANFPMLLRVFPLCAMNDMNGTAPVPCCCMKRLGLSLTHT